MSRYFKPDYPRTFKAWSMDGYKIIKGSKSVGKTEQGEYLFAPNQVTYTRRDNLNYDDTHWDSASDENCCGGPMYGIYGNCD